ncbi:hypothetical protein, partial [Terrisporobacter sp.]|uniref:hypothetical protein n=1 Tax=Terrisporobacter sp. TaxID=1965305 RepID=UPI002A8093EA
LENIFSFKILYKLFKDINTCNLKKEGENIHLLKTHVIKIYATLSDLFLLKYFSHILNIVSIQ